MRRLADKLGLAGILGIGVLLFCATFYWSALAPAQRELAARQSAAAGNTKPQLRPVSSSHGNDLVQLHERFPRLETLTSQVERLHRLGRSAGLQLQQGEYRLETSPAGLASYRISLPVRGEYRALRQFMGSVLKEMPPASIDRLRFERKKPGDAQLEAQIHITLYFKPESQ
jgi:Tfp pilus assembly protein PilO